MEEASVKDEGEGMKEKEVGKEEEEDAFGDFQGAEGVMPAAQVTSTATTAALDSGNTQTEAPAGGEQPQNTAGSIPQTPGQVQEAESSLGTNLTDTATNLQPISPDILTGT